MAIQSRLTRFEYETPIEPTPYNIRGPHREEQTNRGIDTDALMFEATRHFFAMMATEAARRQEAHGPQTTRGWEGDLMRVEIPPRRRNVIWGDIPSVPLFEIGYHYGVWPENNYDERRFQIVVYQRIQVNSF